MPKQGRRQKLVRRRFGRAVKELAAELELGGFTEAEKREIVCAAEGYSAAINTGHAKEVQSK
jgi:hypothetical protein